MFTILFAVGHSVSFLELIINRDSVTQIEAPLNLHPFEHVIATVPFLHLILCLPAIIDFCPKEHYFQGRERSSAACWLFCVQEEGRQHSDTPLCLLLREKVTLFHVHIQRIMHLAAGAFCVPDAQSIHRSQPAYSHSVSSKKESIIYHTVVIIKCSCLVFRCCMQRGRSVAKAHHLLVQMLWKVFKGLRALEKGNRAAFDLFCRLRRRRTGPAMALHPTLPPVTLHPLSSPQRSLSRNNENKGLRVL